MFGCHWKSLTSCNTKSLKCRIAGVAGVALVIVGASIVTGLLWNARSSDYPGKGASEVWDLSGSRDVNSIPLVLQSEGRFWSVEIRRHIRVLFPEGIVFQGEVHRVHLSRWGDEVNKFEFTSYPLRHQEAVERITRLGNSSQLTWTEIQKFASDGEDKYPSLRIISRRDADYHISIEVGPSFDEERPYIVYYKAYWSMFNPDGTIKYDKEVSAGKE